MAESKLSSVLPNNSISDVMMGTPVSTLYANNANVSKVLELLQYNNDVEMSFPSVAFGATNTFRFPRAYQFLKNIIMCLDFTFVGNVATKINEDYFAYHMIKEIKWQLGGTEQFTIKGESLMHIIMEQCENQEKKDMLLDISGTSCGSSGLTVGLAGTRKFYALLPFPWSTLESKKFGQSQYPLPLHMLNDPLEIQITFRSAAECLGGVQTTNWTFDKAVLNFEYAKVASPTHLKNTVYKFPFTCPFSFAYNISGTNKNISVDLNSFRKAELKGISFTYVPNVKVASNQFYNGNKVSDIVVTFNGQIIWKAPHNEMYELIYGKSCNNLGRRKISTVADASNFQYRSLKDSNELLDDHNKATLLALTADDIIVSRANIVSKTDTNLGGELCDRYYYYIPLSEIKDFSQNYSLGVDVSKQSMNLSFKRSDNVDGGKLFVTYHYTALYQFNGDNAIVVF